MKRTIREARIYEVIYEVLIKVTPWREVNGNSTTEQLAPPVGCGHHYRYNKINRQFNL